MKNWKIFLALLMLGIYDSLGSPIHLSYKTEEHHEDGLGNSEENIPVVNGLRLTLDVNFVELHRYLHEMINHGCTWDKTTGRSSCPNEVVQEKSIEDLDDHGHTEESATSTDNQNEPSPPIGSEDEEKKTIPEESSKSSDNAPNDNEDEPNSPAPPEDLSLFTSSESNADGRTLTETEKPEKPSELTLPEGVSEDDRKSTISEKLPKSSEGNSTNNRNELSSSTPSKDLSSVQPSEANISILEGSSTSSDEGSIDNQINLILPAPSENIPPVRPSEPIVDITTITETSEPKIASELTLPKDDSEDDKKSTITEESPMSSDGTSTDNRNELSSTTGSEDLSFVQPADGTTPTDSSKPEETIDTSLPHAVSEDNGTPNISEESATSSDGTSEDNQNDLALPTESEDHSSVQPSEPNSEGTTLTATSKAEETKETKFSEAVSEDDGKPTISDESPNKTKPNLSAPSEDLLTPTLPETNSDGITPTTSSQPEITKETTVTEGSSDNIEKEISAPAVSESENISSIPERGSTSSDEGPMDNNESISSAPSEDISPSETNANSTTLKETPSKPKQTEEKISPDLGSIENQPAEEDKNNLPKATSEDKENEMFPEDVSEDDEKPTISDESRTSTDNRNEPSQSTESDEEKKTTYREGSSTSSDTALTDKKTEPNLSVPSEDLSPPDGAIPTETLLEPEKTLKITLPEAGCGHGKKPKISEESPTTSDGSSLDNKNELNSSSPSEDNPPSTPNETNADGTTPTETLLKPEKIIRITLPKAVCGKNTKISEDSATSSEVGTIDNKNELISSAPSEDNSQSLPPETNNDGATRTKTPSKSKTTEDKILTDVGSIENQPADEDKNALPEVTPEDKGYEKLPEKATDEKDNTIFEESPTSSDGTSSRNELSPPTDSKDILSVQPSEPNADITIQTEETKETTLPTDSEDHSSAQPSEPNSEGTTLTATSKAEETKETKFSEAVSEDDGKPTMSDESLTSTDNLNEPSPSTESEEEKKATFSEGSSTSSDSVPTDDKTEPNLPAPSEDLSPPTPSETNTDGATPTESSKPENTKKTTLTEEASDNIEKESSAATISEDDKTTTIAEESSTSSDESHTDNNEPISPAPSEDIPPSTPSETNANSTTPTESSQPDIRKETNLTEGSSDNIEKEISAPAVSEGGKMSTIPEGGSTSSDEGPMDNNESISSAPSENFSPSETNANSTTLKETPSKPELTEEKLSPDVGSIENHPAEEDINILPKATSEDKENETLPEKKNEKTAIPAETPTSSDVVLPNADGAEPAPPTASEDVSLKETKNKKRKKKDKAKKKDKKKAKENKNKDKGKKKKKGAKEDKNKEKSKNKEKGVDPNINESGSPSNLT